MWLSKVSSLGCPTRANKMRLLVLPAHAFIIALLAVIIFTSLGTRRFQRAVAGKDIWVFRPLLRAGSGAYPENFGGNGMSQSDIDSLLKEDRLFTPAPGFSSAPTSRAAKITTEYTNVQSKTPKGSGQRSPASRSEEHTSELQ